MAENNEQENFGQGPDAGAKGTVGRVISISGPAVDVQFDERKMPPIYQALRISSEGFDIPTPLNVVVEVQQHLGEGRVRCIAMVATEGMVRGMKCASTRETASWFRWDVRRWVAC